MGTDFNELFDDWASHYDETVGTRNHEYQEVFEHYDWILERVAEKASGTTLEFGVGTGNLTEKLMDAGCDVYGIEPSKEMRAAAGRKIPDLPLEDGDFLHYRQPNVKVDTIASTYAFHHLTDHEKKQAICHFGGLLPVGGKVVFADTLFENEEAKESILDRVANQGFDNLLADLKREYYTTKAVLDGIFQSCGFRVRFEQLNRFVWLVDATKV